MAEKARPTPSPAACFLFFEVLLLTRSILYLLRPAQPGLEQPAQGLARALRDAARQTGDPVENLVRGLVEAINEAESPYDDAEFLTQIGVQAKEATLLHKQLGFLGRFELPLELEHGLLLCHSDVGFPYPDTLHLASTGDFALLEHRSARVSGVATSVVAVPAAFANLPLYWPLVAHEYGHMYLRGRADDGGNYSRDTPFVGHFGYAEAALEQPLQMWKGEVLCDYMGKALFDYAFLFPALAYFFIRSSMGLATFTTTHPAPWIRLQLLHDATATDPLAIELAKLMEGVTPLVKPAMEAGMVGVGCVACLQKVTEIASSSIPAQILPEIRQSLEAFGQHLVAMQVKPKQPRKDVIANLERAFTEGTPVDLCFAANGLTADVLTAMQGARASGDWTAMLSQLSCSTPTVAELFAAAWRRRLAIQAEFLAESSKYTNSYSDLREEIDRILESIFFLGENLKAGLRSLWLLGHLERVLKDATERH